MSKNKNDYEIISVKPQFDENGIPTGMLEIMVKYSKPIEVINLEFSIKQEDVCYDTGVI